MSEPVPYEHQRISDADREAAAERLRRAHGEGRITLGEFDERLQLVWTTRTYGELAVVTADLPELAAKPQPPARVEPARHPRPVFRVFLVIYLFAVVINLVTWGLVTLTEFELVYPWFLWVAGPPGVLLAGWYLLGRPRSDEG
ncbi:hypothetical protein JOF53_005039 [Crossiella equi]|uniref:DUF1707 domain-containing protein n=1 Tax=Crossiella equi TaxID=130796 RepID=A0ABS5AHX0_9PSEU|nr:DUF1707 domain-containing protein [Crossiella equi]MBP2476167.1 hypothetical protein [Crossiella equi]